MAGYLAEGHNYGVVTGIGHLIVFDVDDLPRLEELNIINQIPETFTVETGRGGKHFICYAGVSKIKWYSKTLS